MRADRASSTAVLIAESMVYQHYHPKYRGLVPPGTARWYEEELRAYDSGGRQRIDRLRRWWYRLAAEAAQWFLLPGILAHYALRKRLIAELARRELGRGMNQVVVLGAGFDPLARVLKDEFPRARFWEVDHPATQQSKRRVHGYEVPGLSLLAADFSRDSLLESSLAALGFAADQPTLWIAEGLLMYFPASAVQSLLRNVRALSHPGSHVVFSFMESPRNGPIRFRGQSRLVTWWLNNRNEVFRWSSTPDELAGFLRPLGVTLERCQGADDLRAAAGRPISSLAEGEWIADTIIE